MQYPTCMHDDNLWHDGCATSNNATGDPKVMGYAMRTRRYRYIEWVPFDHTTDPPTALWSGMLGAELYDHTVADTVENVAESVNLVAVSAMSATVKALSKQLRAGWRAGLPETETSGPDH